MFLLTHLNSNPRWETHLEKTVWRISLSFLLSFKLKSNIIYLFNLVYLITKPKQQLIISPLLAISHALVLLTPTTISLPASYFVHGFLISLSITCPNYYSLFFLSPSFIHCLSIYFTSTSSLIIICLSVAQLIANFCLYQFSELFKASYLDSDKPHLSVQQCLAEGRVPGNSRVFPGRPIIISLMTRSPISFPSYNNSFLRFGIVTPTRYILYIINLKLLLFFFYLVFFFLF